MAPSQSARGSAAHQAGRRAVIAVILYIKRQSLWLDLKLIALSFWITFRGKWEYRGRKF
jgi:lipopolysaccharide/colanic/teichoic acid biosynthesis glycosyltransferase